MLIAVNISIAQNTLTFEVNGLTCWSCVNAATSVLKLIEGVDSAYVNFDTKEGYVFASRKVERQEIKSAIASKNFEARFEGEESKKPLTEEEIKGLDIETILGGEKLDFEKYLTKRKITIFDFYAKWCGPCRLFSPKLERILSENPSQLSLKKVDVVDWKSPLAKQLTKNYKLPSLPFTLIYNDQGKLIGRIEGNDIESVNKILYNNI